MRSRAWATWLIFTVCALAVLEGLGWVTWKALALERAERSAHAQAEFQERIRLALWRMESEITPILAQEAARPYFHYQSFYPAERAYTRMLQEVSPGEVMVPSPLLDASGPYMRVHYQIGPDGAITSPQSPSGSLRTLAESQYIDREFLVLAGQRMSELTEVIRPVPEAPVREIAITPLAPQAAAPPQPPPMPVLQTEQGQSAQIGQTFDQPVQKQISEKEYQARQNLAQSANSYQQESRRGKGDFGRNSERQAGAVSPAAPPAPGAVGTRAGGGAAPPPNDAPLAAAKTAPKEEGAAYREYAEQDKLGKKSVDLKLEAKSETRVPSETTIEDKAARKVEFKDTQPPMSATPSVRSGLEALSDKTGVRDEERLNLGYKIASVDVSEVELGPFKPLWRQNPRSNTPELFFERAVNIGGIHLRQGLWMDWPALKARLLAATSDLLTGADLVPIPEAPAEAPTAEMLASFPVLLRPAPPPSPPLSRSPQPRT